MVKRLIVVRESPDWLSFDVESSRGFCRRVGVPENTVVEFVDLWDRTLPVGYREFRWRAREIASSTWAAVADAQVVSHVHFSDALVEPDDRIAFTDDDDWYAPDLFSVATNDHGARWGSIRLGREFTPDSERGLDNLVTFRSIDNIIYTNNYLVGGRILADRGYLPLFEHSSAQAAQNDGLYCPLVSDRYLSCANKTPASTVSARYLLSLDTFRSDPMREFHQFAEKLNATELPPPARWMREPFDRFKTLMNEIVRQD